MPTPPKLRLQPLENRSLLSAAYDPPADQVVTGTDANDVITLTRLDEHRVEVTVRSFLDPEWTQPTGDPAVHSEVRLADSELESSLHLAIYPGFRDFRQTTSGIRVEPGAGTDRVEVVDLLGQPYFVRGTYRTDDPPTDELLRVVFIPLVDEAGGQWTYAHDVWTQEIKERYAGTLTEGVDMAEGAAVGVRFDAVPGWWRRETLPYDPCPVPPDDLGDASTDEVTADVFLDATGLDLLVGVEVEDWAAEGFGTGPDGDLGEDWLSDQASLSDLWAAWADDQSDWWAGDGEGGSDGSTGDGPDDWLVTDLEG